MLTALFQFTAIKMKYLTMLIMLFFFTDYTLYALLLQGCYNEIAEYANYAVFFHWLRSLRCFTSVLLKSNVRLRSLRCFTSVLLKWNLWLRSYVFFVYTDYTHWSVLLHYYEMKISDYPHYAVLLSLLLKSNLWLRILHLFSSLTTLTSLFYFATIEMKFLIALTTLFFFND